MGVMACSRNSCENIMCDTYIVDIGYLCYSCQTEFKLFLNVKRYNPVNQYEIKKYLEEFIETEATKYDDKEMSVDEFFNNCQTDKS
jgi:hypothetical protein